jgi:CheY-like chemotaxis protein
VFTIRVCEKIMEVDMKISGGKTEMDQVGTFPKQGMGSVRVLIVNTLWVEMDAIRQVLKEHLGWKVTLVNCGERALKILERQRYDLMITDVAMTDYRYSGFGLIRQVRVDMDLPIPVMIVTNWMVPEVREAARELGVEALIMMPLDARYLVSKALELVRKNTAVDN